MIKRLSVFTICTLISFVSFTGCSTGDRQENYQVKEVASKNSESEKNKKNIAIEEIEKKMMQKYGEQVEKVFVSNKYDENTVLIEVKMKLGSSMYYVYNLATGENKLLPIENSFVKSAKFIDENNLVFEMTGGNSETSFLEPPYRLLLYRIVGNGEFGFVGKKEKINFQLGNSITVGDNVYDAYLLKDIRATLDGIQLDFKASSGETDSFPLIKTSFNESSRQFIIKAEKTKKENFDYLAKVITERPNIYIDSIRLEEDDNALNIILELNENTRNYTAEIRDATFLEICFHNE